jgi:hypothetical protein
VQSVVVKRHEATDSSQLELYVGDIVFVLEKDETGWWGGHKEGEDLTGWFPGFCVEAVQKDKKAAIDCEKAVLRDESVCLQRGSVECARSQKKEDEEDASKRSALETQASSPSNLMRMVATPQRHGLRSGAQPAAEQGVMRASRCSEVLLEEKSRQCSVLDNEVAKLKQDKAALEEALLQVQKQNIEEKENNTKMVSQISEVERRLQAEATQRKSVVLQCEQLQEDLRNRDAEVATLRRLSVASVMTPQMAAQSPIRESHDECARRQPSLSASSGTRMSNAAEFKSITNATANSSPDPIVSSGCQLGTNTGTAAKRTSSRIRGRPSDEGPPVGLVKQLKSAFEARSQTPSRPQSRTRDTTEHGMRAAAWGVSVTAAIGTTSQASRQPIQGLSITAEPAAPAAEEIVYGMSPINSAKPT